MLQVSSAQPTNRSCTSCQRATKRKIGHMLSARHEAPPMGTYMYRTSHRLKLQCQPRQNPYVSPALVTISRYGRTSTS